MSHELERFYALRAIDEKDVELTSDLCLIERRAGMRYLRLRRLEELGCPKLILEHEKELLERSFKEYTENREQKNRLGASRVALVPGNWEDFQQALYEAENELDDEAEQ